MKILVLNGSPSGKNSITLQTVLYLQQTFAACSFTCLHVGQQIRRMERDPSLWQDALRQCDLILFCYPVYTFLVPAQLHRFIELMKASGVDLSGKYATQLTTSKHFYDTTAHRFIEDNCSDLGLRYIRGLSADMEDLLQEQGRQEARAFFRFVLWSVRNGCFTPPRPASAPAPRLPASEAPEAEKQSGSVVVVTDLSGDDSGSLRAMIKRFSRRMPRQVRVVDLQQVRIDGGCLGCFRCASDGTCVYRDGFDAFLREQIQTADATVYAFTIRDHSMGSRFKTFDDRQFCNGHRTVTMGKPVGYLISGDPEAEPNLRMLLEARAQVGGNFLAGVASDCRAPDEEIDRLAKTLAYALDKRYLPPKEFYGVGGLKIFRDLIYQMRGLMKEDHRFYKQHGFYDFPQKRKGRIAAMYLVGAMMNNPKLRKKLGGKMTEGMLMPYEKVRERAAKRQQQAVDKKR